MSDKQHFLNEARERGKQKRTQAREHKKETLNSLTRQSLPGTHSWAANGNGVQCQKCKVRLTMHSKLQDIQDGRTACCEDSSALSVVGALKNSFKEKLVEMSTNPVGMKPGLQRLDGPAINPTTCGGKEGGFGALAAKHVQCLNASKALQRQCVTHVGQVTLPACFRPKVDEEQAA